MTRTGSSKNDKFGGDESQEASKHRDHSTNQGEALPPSSLPPGSPTTLIPHDEATVPCATCGVVPGDIVDLLAVVTAAVALHNEITGFFERDPSNFAWTELNKLVDTLGAALRNLGVPEDES